MPNTSLSIQTNGERFYDITPEVASLVVTLCGGETPARQTGSGILFLWNPHTSCALTISEAYDPSARTDMEKFMRHLAPQHLPFIEHTAEGPDDSPSHMKSLLLQPSLVLPIAGGQLQLGQWQGIYLAEFRAAPHTRRLRADIVFTS